MYPKRIDKAVLSLLPTMLIFGLIGCDEPSHETKASETDTQVKTTNSNVSIVNRDAAQDALRSGTEFVGNGEYANAVQAFSRAIELNPRFVMAFTFRGLSYLQLGNFVAAIKDLDTAVALDPTADSYRTRADVYARNGYFEKAIVDYDKLLQLDPRSASGFNNRATTYGDQGNFPKAIADATKAIELESREPKWYLARAVLKAKQEDYNASMRDAEIALTLAGDVPSLQPGEQREVSEIRFNCLRMIADLEKAGARRSKE